MTHTFAVLEVSRYTYDEIAAKLKEAEYGDAFVEDYLDMHGIGLFVEKAEPNTKHFQVKNPLVVMFEAGGNIICRIYPRSVDSHGHYGLLICDLVRHVASCFKVEEDDVWEWVMKEKNHPTTEISRPS